jgi:NitT/TauT family transport system substrate-binding protein
MGSVDLKLILILLVLILIIAGCSKPPEPSVKIAINLWPGYEYLILAQQLGFYQDVGLNVELVPFSSLSDSQRAYVSGRVDGLASTMIEVVQSQVLGTRPLTIALLPDYSNGGDVVVAINPIDTLAALKGKRVGAEISSLGIYMLHRTLSSAGLSLNDVELVNVEQSAALKAFNDQRIDAFVTYPPHSIDLLKLNGMQTIFTSADIPFDIIDTVSIASDVIQANPDFVPLLHSVWQRALDFAAANPHQANAAMADREGIAVDEFTAALSDIHLLNRIEQKVLFEDSIALQKKVIDVCQVLALVDAITYECSKLPNMIYQGKL